VNKIRSTNGVPLLSGLGISSVQDKIKSAFEVMRAATQLVAPVPLIEVEVVNVSREEAVARFHARVEQSNLNNAVEYLPAEFDRHADRLTRSALTSDYIVESATDWKRHSFYVGDLNEQPRAEDLFANALQPPKLESKRKRSS